MCAFVAASALRSTVHVAEVWVVILAVPACHLCPARLAHSHVHDSLSSAMHPAHCCALDATCCALLLHQLCVQPCTWLGCGLCSWLVTRVICVPRSPFIMLIVPRPARYAMCAEVHIDAIFVCGQFCCVHCVYSAGLLTAIRSRLPLCFQMVQS